MTSTITKTFTITTSPTVMRRLEFWFGLLHFNSRFGHSGIFAMPLDGDGSDKVTVEPVPGDPLLHRHVNLIGEVGRDVEVVTDDGFRARNFDRNEKVAYITRPGLRGMADEPVATLWREGTGFSIPVKTLPPEDESL